MILKHCHSLAAGPLLQQWQEEAVDKTAELCTSLPRTKKGAVASLLLCHRITFWTAMSVLARIACELGVVLGLLFVSVEFCPGLF